MATGKDRGFTLIEVAVAISIFLLIVGMAIPLVGANMQEGSLGRDEAGLQKLVRLGQHRALEQRSRHTVQLLPDAFVLSELYVPDSEIRRWTLAKGTTYRFRYGTAGEWNKPEGQDWIIQANGLARPLQFILYRGDYQRGLRFNPLTLMAEPLESP